MKITTKHIKAIIIILLCSMFLITLSKVVDTKILEIDQIIFESMHRTNLLTSIMKVITFLGESISIIILCVLLLIFLKEKKYKLPIALNLIFITIITQGLKFLIKRPRPLGTNIIPIDGFSFPSGHTTTAVAFYGFLIYIIYKDVKNKKIKNISIILLTMLIILIGISRIYLGVHYTSDVFAGFSLATAYILVFIMLLENNLIKNK